MLEAALPWRRFRWAAQERPA